MFAGKRIWMVGASDGIGAALARLLAQEGATLALSARSEDKLNALKADCAGDGHCVVPLDVTDQQAVYAAWDTLCKEWPSVDVVMYIAGTYTPMNVDKIEAKAVAQTLDVNLHGLFHVLDKAVPEFLAKQAGHLVIFGSVAGYRGLPGAYAYGASKAAVNHLTEILAVELEPKGIKVQLVCPGFVRTQLTDKNEFKMPFMLEVEDAAKRTLNGLKSGAFEVHYPKRFTLSLKALKFLPFRLYSWVIRNAAL